MACTAIKAGSSGNINLYPKWELEKYNVIFVMPDGTRETSIVEYGKSASIPEYSKSIFEIFKTDVNIDKITGNTTVKVSIINIWYVYALVLLVIVGTILTIFILHHRKMKQLHKLRYIYQSNLAKRKNKGINR